MPDVGVVIVTHRNPQLARACAASLPEIPNERLVVVVNDPTGCDQDELKRLEDVHRVLRNVSAPRGYGANLNAGAAELGASEFLLLLNDDVVFPPRALDQMTRELVSRPDFGVLGPRIVGADGVPQASVFQFPSVRSELVQILMLPSKLSYRLRSPHGAPVEDGQPTEADWILGAALLVRSETWLTVGGFDESFFMYSEETDFCRRARRAGWLVGSLGEVTVMHHGEASTAGGPRYSAMLGESRRRYHRKHSSRLERISLAVAVALAFLWNLTYVAIRSVLQPGSASAKVKMFKAAWAVRPALRRSGLSP